MKEAHFYYGDRMLGIIMYDPELKDGYFFYSFNSLDSDAITTILPSTIINILEDIKFDVKDPDFDYEKCISTKMGSFYWKEIK